MLDRDGFRPNVGIILVNAKKQVFWGKRVKEHSWQFPQGGIKYGESPEQAMLRELREEVGLLPEHVQIIGRTRHWLRYEVPDQWIRREWRGNYRGQKQIWFLLKLVGRDSDICLRATDHPEFDAWRWHDYWIPLEGVIEFKQDVYRRALHELARLLFGRNDPRRIPKADIWKLPDNEQPAHPVRGRPFNGHPANAGHAPDNGAQASQVAEVSSTEAITEDMTETAGETGNAGGAGASPREVRPE